MLINQNVQTSNYYPSSSQQNKATGTESSEFAAQMSDACSATTRSCFYDENGNEVLHDGGYNITIVGESGGSFVRSEHYSSANPVYNVSSFFKGYADPYLGMDYNWTGQINVKNIDLNNASAIEMDTLRQHLKLNVHIPSETDQRVEQNYVQILESEVVRLQEEGEWQAAKDCQSALNEMLAYTGTPYNASMNSSQAILKTVDNPSKTQGETNVVPRDTVLMGQTKEDSVLNDLKNQLNTLIESTDWRARFEMVKEKEEEQEQFDALLEKVDKAIAVDSEEIEPEESWFMDKEVE
ncbi:MAG: hypothetical protein R3Y63_04615 [Eubacteriales bacterium]